MELMWFEIKFSEFELNQGKAVELEEEIRKLHRILDNIDGIKLYAGKYWKEFGQKYFLTVPDNSIGRNLMQYFKLKNYIPCEKPEIKNLKIKYEGLQENFTKEIIKPVLTSPYILN